MPLTTCNQKEFLIESKLNGFLRGFLLHVVGLKGEREDEVKLAFSKTTRNILSNFVNRILMPVSICPQKEFLIESKLNGFWGVLLLLLDIEIFIWEVK